MSAKPDFSTQMGAEMETPMGRVSRRLCVIDERPISPDRLFLIGRRKAKTCSPACSTENKRRLRVKGATASRNRARAKAASDEAAVRR